MTEIKAKAKVETKAVAERATEDGRPTTKD